MNNYVSIALVILVAASASAFVGYWIGRDAGEKSTFVKKADQTERLLRANHDLRIENMRLQKAMNYYDDGVLRSILDQIDDGPGPWSGQG